MMDPKRPSRSLLDGAIDGAMGSYSSPDGRGVGNDEGAAALEAKGEPSDGTGSHGGYGGGALASSAAAELVNGGGIMQLHLQQVMAEAAQASETRTRARESAMAPSSASRSPFCPTVTAPIG